MSFESIDKLINTLGAAEKQASDNYLIYLDTFFPNWNELTSITSDNGQSVKTLTLTDSAYGEIYYKDTDLSNPYRIVIYENNELPYQVMLNRRNNATILQQEVNGSTKIQYLGDKFVPYLTIIKDVEDNVQQYELTLFDQIHVFEEEEEVLAFFDEHDLHGVDYVNRALVSESIEFNENKMTIKLAKILLNDVNDVMIGDHELSFEKFVENDTLSLELSEFSGMKKGFNPIKVSYKNVPFRLSLNPEIGVSNERYVQFLAGTETNYYWLINRNSYVGMLARDAETDGIVPIVTNEPLDVSKYHYQHGQLMLSFNGGLNDDVQFYTIEDRHEVIFNYQKVHASEYVVELSKFPEIGLFVRYGTVSGTEVRQVSANNLVRDYLENSTVELVASHAEGDVSLSIRSDDMPEHTNMYLRVLNRGTKETVLVAPTEKVSAQTTNVQFELKLSDFPESVNFNLADYDATIYDLSLVLEDDIDRVLTTHQRLQWHEEIQEEITGSYQEPYSFMVAPYGTSNNQELSLRTYFIPTDALAFYQEQKMNTERQRNKKPVIVVAESPNKAQDNGLHMFKYLVDQHGKRLDVYYVLTADSPDIANLAGYEKHVLVYKSLAHFEVMGKVDMVLHTNSSFYAYPLNTSYWEQERLKTKKIFLQHGIIGVRDLAALYGAQTMFTNKFVVSSEREKSIVVDKMGYKPKNVVNTGLARFDVLLKSSSIEKTKSLRDKIVIMPSWRKFQDRLQDEDFIETEFYKGWQAFINSPSLVEYAQANNLEIVFYLHHNFQKYVHLFKSPVVRMVPEDEVTIQELLLNNGILITDFSSVALDFALQERKVFYYQVDDAITDEVAELAPFFPGDIYYDSTALISDVMQAVQNPILSDSEKTKLDGLYTYRDTKARERTYAVMARMLQAGVPKPVHTRVKNRIKRLIHGRK